MLYHYDATPLIVVRKVFNKVDIECDLVEENCRCNILSALFLKKNEHQEIKTLVNHFAPNCKTYWRYVWPGALIAAILFEVAKGIFIWYLDNLATYDQVYGSVTSVMSLLLWMWVSALILIMGAEISSEYGRMKEGVDRGQLIHPLSVQD